MKVFFTFFIIAIMPVAFTGPAIDMQINQAYSIDSLGACQGASFQKGILYLYGDREVGMMRAYKMDGDALHYLGREYKLTQNGKDLINHPTGIASKNNLPVFIGNSIRLNKEGTSWKAVIYCINWEGLLKTGTLDGNIINTIDDDTCVQGTRPEYVRYNDKWYVATADYGDKRNEVRLYDPSLLKHAKKTSEAGILIKKFTCAPWVQNLHFIPDKNVLVLIQNQQEGKKWRFTYLDLKKSLDSGSQQVIKVIDINDRNDELEGFTFLNNDKKGVAVSSSQSNNVNVMDISW